MLAQYQSQFCDNLLSLEVDTEFLAQIEGLDQDLAIQRLSVYRNNVLYSLGTALGDLYPVVKRLVGDAAFRTLASSFIRQHPPRQPVITFYGECFPAYIDEFLQQRGVEDLAYLSDVARFEWLMHSAYYAADDTPLELTSLEQIHPDKIDSVCLTPAASVQLMRSNWPVVAIWEENIKQEPGHIEIQAFGEPADTPGLVFYRHDYRVQYMELEPTCFSLLGHLLSGASLGEAMAMVEGCDDVEELSAMLAFLLGKPLFSEFQLDE